MALPYPLVWTMLDKKGNSNSDERIDLLDGFGKIFPDTEIAYISGDREFVGEAEIAQALQRLSETVDIAKKESGLDEDALSRTLDLSHE